MNQIAEKNRLVTVCKSCKMAACWRGIFMCDNANGADIEQLPVSRLQELGLEHPDYYAASDDYPEPGNVDHCEGPDDCDAHHPCKKHAAEANAGRFKQRYSDAGQLAAEAAYELFEFSQLRARREHQWQRLGIGWPWHIKYYNITFLEWWEPRGLSRIHAVYRWGHTDPNPTQRLMVLADLQRDRDQLSRRKSKQQ